MNDERFMRRCFFLAKQGLGKVSPNPMVGAVIVKNGQIIGEGYHQKHGCPHAEVNAIKSVRNPNDLKEATIYVNLEPCSHHGKTPPCADLIIASGIPKVVVCNADPNPIVSGNGFKKLREAGIKVKTNVLEAEGRILNRRFFINQEKKRPYIILKWAQSMDGLMDINRGESEKGVHWISHPNTQKWVHKWRGQEDAILVGGHTVANDNPTLTTRKYKGRNPQRIVLSKNGNIPQAANLLTDGLPTWILNQKKAMLHGAAEWIKLPEKNFLNHCLTELINRNIGSVFIEGGRETLQSFIDAKLWDEARIITGTTYLKNGLNAPEVKKYTQIRVEKLGKDTLTTLLKD